MLLLHSIASFQVNVFKLCLSFAFLSLLFGGMVALLRFFFELGSGDGLFQFALFGLLYFGFCLFLIHG